MNKIVALCIALIVAVVLFFLFMSGKSKEPKILTMAEIETSKTTASVPPPKIAQEQNKIEEKESAPGNGTDEAPVSLDQEKEINNFLAAWKNAWQATAGKNGNIADYTSFYSEDFNAEGLDKNGWAKSKGSRNAKKEWIDVLLNNITIKTLDKNTIQVTFSQEYSSSNFSDKSVKQLTLKKENSDWKILSEQ